MVEFLFSLVGGAGHAYGVLCMCVYSVCEGGGGTYQVPGSSFDVRVKNVQILVSCEISPHSWD